MEQYTADTKSAALHTILWAGFIVGSLDILSAFAKYYIDTGKNPLTILNFIASGVFGKEAAYTGGNSMAVWGLVLHFIIAFAFTVFFFWVYPKWNALAKNKIVTAIGYGLFVWVVMNLVILPLSALPKRPFQLSQAIIGALILIGMIGLPLSFIIGNYYSKKMEKNNFEIV